MTLQFRLYVDFDRDGFGTDDDLSPYLKGGSFQSGISDPEALTAAVGRCILHLDNRDGRFSPASGHPISDALKPNLPLRLEVISDGLNYPLFSGFSLRWVSDSGLWGRRECLLEGVDGIERLRRAPAAMPLQMGVRADRLIRSLINRVWDAPAAVGAVGFNANPSDGAWLRLDDVIYTFKNPLQPSTPNQVLIGATVEHTSAHLIAAINGEGGAGNLYTEGSSRPAGARAEPQPTYQRAMIGADAIRYYRLGDVSSGSTHDSGINGRAGTVVGGVSAITGALGGDPDGAAGFDGSSGLIEVPPLALDARALCIEAWLKPDPSMSAPGDWFSAYQDSAAGGWIALRVYPDGALGIVGQGLSVATAAGVIPLGSWSHVAMVRFESTSQSALYVNGSPVGLWSIPSISAVQPQIRIGTGISGAFFKGGIDELAISYRDFDHNQIRARVLSRDVPRGVRLRALMPGAAGNDLNLDSSGGAINLSPFAGGGDQPTDAEPQIENGVQFFDLAGDGWSQDSTHAAEAFRQITHSEQGLFWCDREGALIWKNGHFFLKQAAVEPVMTLNGEMRLIGAVEGGAAMVQVTAAPRARSSLNTVMVARVDAPLLIPGQAGRRGYDPLLPLTLNPEGGRRTVILKFLDPESGAPAGADDLILPPEPGIDWEANEQPDGSGADYSTYGALQIKVESRGGEAVVTFHNSALGRLYITRFQLRGRLITRYAPLNFEAHSPYAKGEGAPLRVDLPLPLNPAFAASLADYLVARWGEPAYRLRALEGSVLRIGGVSVFAPQIGQTIRVSEGHTGISGLKALITGISAVFEGGALKTIRYEVRRLDDLPFGLLDDPVYGKFDQSLRFGV